MNESNNIIIKKQAHKSHGPGHSSAWKIALADFAVAMMAFFMLMWIVISTTEAEKVSISGYFQNPNTFITGHAPVLLPNMNPLTSTEKTSSSETGNSALDSFLLEEAGKMIIDGKPLGKEEVKKTIDDMNNLISTGKLEVEVRTDRIIIRIMENGSFASGSSEIRSDFIPVLKKVAKVLHITPGQVAVSGYTDNRPIMTAIFRSNRELSAVRAVSVAEELLKDTIINPDRFIIRGHGENNPIVSNDTPEGRTRNRRVEVEILQGEKPDSKEKIFTIEKDADTEVLPNIEKTDAFIDSVFPPETDVDFDGTGTYLEKGELGIFDYDTLYNYEVNDKIEMPTTTKTDELPILDKPIEEKTPDDLGVVPFKQEENTNEKTPDDLGVFKEEQKAQPKSKEDLGIFSKQIKENIEVNKELKEIESSMPPKEKELDKQPKTDDLGLYAEEEESIDSNDGLGLYKPNEQEKKDPNDLGIIEKVQPKEKTKIKIEND